MKYSFKLHTTGNLKLIIIQPEETLTNPTPVSVVYELAGDSLKIVVAPPGLRPKEISAKTIRSFLKYQLLFDYRVVQLIR